MLLSPPVDWPSDAPEYNSLPGWEYEKKLVRINLIKEMTEKNNREGELIEKLLFAFELSVLTLEACALIGDINRAKNMKNVANKIKRALDKQAGLTP